MAEMSTRSGRFLPARYYLLLLELAGQHGADLDALLGQTGIDPAALASPDVLLDLDQVDALIEAATAATARSDLGFHLGRMIKPSNHELLGYALMTSATLDEALHMAARYWRLITPTFTLRHERAASGVHIHIEPALELKPLTLRFHVEAIATAFHAELAFLLSTRISAYDIYLPETLSDAASRYRRLKPARVHFGLIQRAGLRIELPTGMTAQPLALADRNALSIARRRCDEELSRLIRHGSLGEWLMMILDQASDHQPRQHELARILHLSTRTLNRRLAAEGTSFREIGLRSRHRRACRLLLDGGLSITRIAMQLGYRDAANFTRAFRRASGRSPIDYRKSGGS